jgi:hypothetical protein
MICLSDNAYQQIKGKVPLDVSDMGERQLKNIAQAVRIYSVSLDAAPAGPVLALPDKPSIAVMPFTNMSGDPEQEYFSDGITEDIAAPVVFRYRPQLNLRLQGQSRRRKASGARTRRALRS